jgi:E3 ubiquitin-protein ligase HERC2
VYAWGSSEHGQCGLGDTAYQFGPRLLTSLYTETATMVACGGSHSLALTGTDADSVWKRALLIRCADEGAVYSWGNGKDGRLGHEDMQSRFAPARVGMSGPSLPPPRLD